MLISAVLAIISGFISLNLYKTHTIIPICSRVENISQVNGSTVIKNYTTPGCSETFSLVVPIMKSAVTLLITPILFSASFILYLVSIHKLDKKIGNTNTCGKLKFSYEQYYNFSSMATFAFFFGLFGALLNVAFYYQILTILMLSLNTTRTMVMTISLKPYSQLLSTIVAISMSIITSYAWRITTPPPGTRWSKEISEVMWSIRDGMFIIYILVLIPLIFSWSLSSIEVSYKLSSLNGTPVLLLSASFSMIPSISFFYAFIIALMTTAIYGLYFAKVLLDTIYSQ